MPLNRLHPVPFQHNMGLGKTFQAITLIITALGLPNVRKVLVATPSNVIRNWQQEIR